MLGNFGLFHQIWGRRYFAFQAVLQECQLSKKCLKIGFGNCTWNCLSLHFDLWKISEWPRVGKNPVSESDHPRWDNKYDQGLLLEEKVDRCLDQGQNWADQSHIDSLFQVVSQSIVQFKEIHWGSKGKRQGFSEVAEASKIYSQDEVRVQSQCWTINQ